MEPHRISSAICRISRGLYYITINGQLCTVRQPSIQIQHEAQELYDDILTQHRFSPWMTPARYQDRLIRNGLLSLTHKEDMKALQESLDNHKIDLYKNYTNIKQQKKIRMYIKMTNKRIADLYNMVHGLEVITAVGYALSEKITFLTLNTIHIGKTDELLFDDTRHISHSLLSSVMHSMAEISLSSTDYRQIARSDLWREYWRAAKTNPFPDAKHYTDEQIQLINYSQLYDSVYSNPEAAPYDVIEDNDMLDGWLLTQKAETEDIKKERRSNKMSSQHGKADEVYIMAHTKADAKKIDDMNTLQSSMTKKQRESAIKKAGTLKEGQLPDRKMQTTVAANQAFKDHMKK